jgi:hypothetical protein
MLNLSTPWPPVQQLWEKFGLRNLQIDPDIAVHVLMDVQLE